MQITNVYSFILTNAWMYGSYADGMPLMALCVQMIVFNGAVVYQMQVFVNNF